MFRRLLILLSLRFFGYQSKACSGITLQGRVRRRLRHTVGGHVRVDGADA